MNRDSIITIKRLILLLSVALVIGGYLYALYGV